jgi:hypothetical protein
MRERGVVGTIRLHPPIGAEHMSSLIEFMRRGGHRLATHRAPLAVVVVATGWLCLGTSSAWADMVIDTTACAATGAAELSATPNTSNDWGAQFVAPTGYLTSFAADVAADGDQPVTLALYGADSSGPIGGPLWTAPATIDSTGSTSTYAVQTFTVDHPVTPGNSYVFALVPGPATANAWWATDSSGAGSGACYPGPVVSGNGTGGWFPPLTYESFVYKADFGTPAPPAVSPGAISFPSQLESTIGAVQTVTINSPGDVPVTLGQLNVTGSDPADFVVVADQCSVQTLTSGQTCTVGVRFAPQAAGAATRTATLNIPYGQGPTPPTGAGNPPVGVVTVSLSGPVTSAPAAPVPGGSPVGGQGASTSKIELVTCKQTTKTVTSGGHSRRVAMEQCTTESVSAPVVLPSGSGVIATLSRGGVVDASGRGSSARVELIAHRTLKRGTYVLSERRGRTTTRLQVTLA